MGNTLPELLTSHLLCQTSFQQLTGFCITLFHCGYDIFGSGTKLYVTDNPVVKPVVSVYPAASRAHHEGKSSLLCVASGMFPPLVRFSWKRRKENSLTEELAPAEEEQLELRESGRTAAIRVIDRDALYTYKYRCYVQHEGGEVEAQTEQEVPAICFLNQVKLLCVLYTVLIVKSLVYCCGLSLLRIPETRDRPPAAHMLTDCFPLTFFHLTDHFDQKSEM
ncbi:immunoglobulin lambda-like polypeptide 1 [Micropterus salmoides]|uniref:immunoglobulin lambda-like polypeptide 1 n=1 Tax=Micropterus salmoides TaxID=27706 RepID=UPI0018EDEE49|nr:immunoglobulin lambda-like polypeptide 1 [Micropterus salmoides]